MGKADIGEIDKLMEERDAVVKLTASQIIFHSVCRGYDSTVDLLLNPRYDLLGNVANRRHFHQYSDLGIIKSFVRAIVYEIVDNAFNIAEHPLRGQFAGYDI